MLLESRVVNAKRPKKTEGATTTTTVTTTKTIRCSLSSSSWSLFLCLLFFVFCLVIPRVAPCDVIGATYCIHKPDKDLKEENLEEYCDKYKEHLECVYSKYKGCDKKEKYVEAMESMIKGLRKKAKQIEVLCEIDIDIPNEETKKVNNSQDVRTGGGGGGSSGGLTRPTKPTTTTTPCKISLISSECHSILPNIQFTPTWNGVQKQKWCNSAGVYSNCLKTRMVNCYGSQYSESLAYYEKIQKYIHTQANLNCPGGLEGCIANPNDVRCKMGVKYGETSGGASSTLYQSQIMTMFKLLLTIFFIYFYHNYQDIH